MILTDEEKNDLAEVLAERLEGFPVRRATAEGAGMVETDVGGEPVHRWRLLVDQAIEKGKLIALLKSAAAHSPGDRVLDKLVDGAERGTLVLPEVGPAPPPWRALIIGVGGAIVIVLAALAGVRFVDKLDDMFPAPAPGVPAPGPDGEVVPTDGQGVEVRTGLLTEPKPPPRPTPHHDAPAPVVEPEVVAPAPAPGRFIRIPDPSEPAPEPTPAPTP